MTIPKDYRMLLLQRPWAEPMKDAEKLFQIPEAPRGSFKSEKKWTQGKPPQVAAQMMNALILPEMVKGGCKERLPTHVITPKQGVQVDYQGDYIGDRVLIWVGRKSKTALHDRLVDIVEARRKGIGIKTDPTYFNAEGKVCKEEEAVESSWDVVEGRGTNYIWGNKGRMFQQRKVHLQHMLQGHRGIHQEGNH